MQPWRARTTSSTVRHEHHHSNFFRYFGYVDVSIFHLTFKEVCAYYDKLVPYLKYDLCEYMWVLPGFVETGRFLEGRLVTCLFQQHSK